MVDGRPLIGHTSSTSDAALIGCHLNRITGRDLTCLSEEPIAGPPRRATHGPRLFHRLGPDWSWGPRGLAWTKNQGPPEPQGPPGLHCRTLVPRWAWFYQRFQAIKNKNCF